ncbi:T9SS type A sorting domain-containing protein, partial [bacterium]|nr:T9SS type A sorting domain-containing protein [bacterium]
GSEVRVLWQENNEEWQLKKHVLRFSNPELPQQFNLRQNYPNPFNGQTIFRYSLPENQTVEFTVSNLLGQTVWTHNQGFQMAGNHVFHWNAAGLPSGVYYFQIKTSEYTAVKRCVLLE